jgi:CRP/FNR family transcriptional regulator, dissimilatory nitrate respiration regulator
MTDNDSSLGPLAQSDIFKNAPERVVETGGHLFRQGDPATAIYFVTEGRLLLERMTSDGGRIVLHDARAGDMLAEAALFSEVYHCNAVAQEASRVRVYDKAALMADLKPGSTCAALLKFMAAQLQRARGRVEFRNIRSATERVLLFMENRADRDGDVEIAGELQDIAHEVGLTREAFYRAVATLTKAGRIVRAPGKISLRRSDA